MVAAQNNDNLQKLKEQENKYNSDLRQAVMQNKNVDLNQAQQTKTKYQEDIKTQQNIDQQNNLIERINYHVTQIEHHQEDIAKYKAGTKRGGSRGEKISNYRIAGEVAAIKYLEDQLSIVQQGSSINIDQTLINSKNIENKTTKALNQKRLKNHTPGDSLNKTSVHETTTINATLSGVGTNKEVETIATTKGGVTTISEITRERVGETSTKQDHSPQMQKTPLIQNQILKNTFVAGGVPGIDQETQTNTPIKSENIDEIKNVDKKLILRDVKNVAAERARQKEYQEAGHVKKYFMTDWSEASQAWDDQGSHGKALITGAVAGVQNWGVLTRSLVTHPIDTSKQIIMGLPELPFKIAEHATKNPAGFAGQIASDIVIAGGASRVVKGAINKGKDVYVRAGSKYIAEEEIFARSVLEGAELLPKAKSIQESAARFEAAEGVVQTSAPSKLSSTEAGFGKKASQGLEDPGIYVTPAGEGSPYFLRVSEVGQKVEYSLNPLKNINKNVPSVTRFETKGVEILPREVVAEAGFESVAKFHEAQAGSGKAYITKRSEIGQGNIQAQNFEAQAGSGKIVREVGTSEIEAVIPYKQNFEYIPQTTAGKIKGFDYYTTFNGRNIAIRDAKLITEEVAASASKVAAPKTPGSKQISGQQIFDESISLSSVVENIQYKSPYPASAAKIASSSNLFNKNSSSFSNSKFKQQSNISNLSNEPSQTASSKSDPYSKSSLSQSSKISSQIASEISSSKASSGGSSGGGSSGGSSFGGSSGGGSSGGSSFGSDPFTPGAPPLKLPKPDNKKIIDPFSKGSKKAQHKGQYIGSLTGLARGLKTTKDQKDLTGLEIRATKINNKNKW